ncbi:hypothetical protein SCH01S_39_01770 [Sphingomonas changbaiensis NBRC 104936]|uniref:ATPase AAA-type core domain-containing protein n=1 Tax=Sphingomonas changbaiensis NBRC 104936 TaxID=1219043 RepID=A0A0E9MQ66_9SPHN|nr:hypothetical protein SCH01S_39_01770 [Sphingomonas changbaiensis NBRC 104936]
MYVRKELKERPEPTFNYRILETARARAHEFDIDVGDFRGAWRSGLMRNYYYHMEERIPPQRRVREEIEKLININWISVHRASLIPNDEQDKMVSPIDRKLRQVARDFGAYFSTLDKRAAEETDKFQQIYLLSLISPSQFESIRSVASVDAEEEKIAIKGVFSEFNIASGVFGSKLESFTKRMATAIKNYAPDKPISGDDFLVLTDTARIHGLINQWHRLLDKRAQIYTPKTDFVNIVNSLFYKKRLSISAGNEPVFEETSGARIPLDQLSSGEKQMFILLGETLLQRGAHCVFMADEPEISLHIDWQMELVPSIRKINPNAQIIFATHSPDIVGAYSKNTINLEKII